MGASDIENPPEKSKGPVATRMIYKVKKVCSPHEPYVSIWRKIFVTSCVFAILLDPLFFYLLIVDEENKCLEMDQKLRNVSLLFRGLTDIILLLHFICEIYRRLSTPNKKEVVAPTVVEREGGGGGSTPRLFIQVQAIARGPLTIARDSLTIARDSLIVDFLALLPVPQLLIVVTFYKMRGSGLERLKILKFLLLAQYIPRIYRIRLSSKKLRKTAQLWIAVLFNFSFYILFSHVLGGYWYFFSIDRETSCWYSACEKYSTDPTRCMNSFHCNSQTTRNITFLNEHCPLDTPDRSLPPFNFGIFLDSLKNNTKRTGFRKKLLYSFWWGLRNISNFGTNLTTSTYFWENFFAILICITSFILISFLYEMGKNHMALEKSKVVERMIYLKRLDVDKLIRRKEIPADLKEEIIKNINEIVEGHRDADLQSDLFSILPAKTRKSLKLCLCSKIQETVPILKKFNKTSAFLEMLCDHMKPLTYDENSFPFRMGDPLDRMLFIVEGTMWTYCSTSDESQSVSTSASTRMTAKSLGKGQFFGEELLDWASPNFTDLPVSRQHVKSHTKVKAFALMAEDLSYVVSKFPILWYLYKCHDSQEAEKVAASAITRAFRHRKSKQQPMR